MSNRPVRSSRLASIPTPRAEISASGPRRSSRHTLDDRAPAGNDANEEGPSGSDSSGSSEDEDEDEKEAEAEAESGARYTFRDRASAKRHVSDVSASAREVAAALHPSKSRLPPPGSSRAVPSLSRRRSSRRHGAKASSAAAPSSDYTRRSSSANPRKRARSPTRPERPRYGGGGGGGYSSSGSSSSGGDSSSDNYLGSGGRYSGRSHRGGSGYSSSGSSNSDDYYRSHSKSSRRRGRDHGAHYGAGGGGGLSKGGTGGSSLEVLRADAAPLDADTQTSFDMVGGLDEHLASLKEMVALPLMYPELFRRFGLSPPKGVLFWGPPGTGKTLVARALASSCFNGSQPVAFFMRKGADVLSKWVGEAEKQLRVLFEEARRQQPSVIFFDEMDGLAPVRSSKQDQIHASIVSTLLALMDGLDSRGQVIVVGATNRPDALDPALRRPGRFDRELEFKLPTCAARKAIVEVHTRHWQPPLPSGLSTWVAERSVGYCGADLKAIVAEAALAAFKRRYPQVYTSPDKLLINPSEVIVSPVDFASAMSRLVPASHRGAAPVAVPLPPQLQPLCGAAVSTAVEGLKIQFPPSLGKTSVATGGGGGSADFSTNLVPNLQAFSTDSSANGNGHRSSSAVHHGESGNGAEARDLPHQDQRQGGTFSRSFGKQSGRARLLVSGPPGCGQKEVALAVLHHLEELPTFVLDLPSLLADPSRSGSPPATVLAEKIAAAHRAAPCVLFLPNAHAWFPSSPSSSSSSNGHSTSVNNYEMSPHEENEDVSGNQHDSTLLLPQLGSTLLALLDDLPPSLPILVLSTAHVESAALPLPARTALISSTAALLPLNSTSTSSSSSSPSSSSSYPSQRAVERTGLCELALPTADARATFLHNLLDDVVASIHEAAAAAEKGQPADEQAPALEELPLAPKVDVANVAGGGAAASGSSVRDAATREEERKMLKREHTLRELRICLSSVLHELHRDKRFAPFWRPVDPEEAPEYFQVIAEPMDLETIRNKVDAHMYPTLRTFLRDLNLIQTNAEEFNPRSLVRHGRYGGGGSSSSSGAYASAGAYKNASDLSHAAHSMMDTVHSMVYRLKGEVGHIFKRCDKMHAEAEQQPPPLQRHIASPSRSSRNRQNSGTIATGVSLMGAAVATAGAASAAATSVTAEPRNEESTRLLSKRRRRAPSKEMHDGDNDDGAGSGSESDDENRARNEGNNNDCEDGDDAVVEGEGTGNNGNSSQQQSASSGAMHPASNGAFATVDADALRALQEEIVARKGTLVAATAGWSVDALVALSAQVEFAVRGYLATGSAEDLLSTLDSYCA